MNHLPTLEVECLSVHVVIDIFGVPTHKHISPLTICVRYFRTVRKCLYKITIKSNLLKAL